MTDTRNVPSDVAFLRNLAEKLRHVPGTYDIDDGDIDRLRIVAQAKDMTCPLCRSPNEVEAYGESGEFWWHCHACDEDFEKDDS